MPDRRLWRHFDISLLVSMILLIAAGVVMIYSAAHGDPEIDTTPIKQATTALIGLLGLFVITLIDYTLLRPLAAAIYIAIILLLVGVLFFGVVNFGARRWYNLGGFDFQPGEVAKLLIGVVIATFIDSQQGKRPYAQTVILSFLLVLPCVVLVLLQPNLSTALIILFIWLAIVFVGGLNTNDVAIMSGAGLLMLLLIFGANFFVERACLLPAQTTTPSTATTPPANAGDTNTTTCRSIIPEYQLQRLNTFFGSGTKDENYQSEQALIALASGNVWGQGYLKGTQSQLRFLPVRHTDFIFSVVGEELGFVGGALIIFMIVFIIFRSLRAAWLARDTFGRLICVSVAAVFFLQTYINIGMQVGMLPVTGVVLPFVSYGRSNLIAAMAAIGLVESVVMRYKKLEF